MSLKNSLGGQQHSVTAFGSLTVNKVGPAKKKTTISKEEDLNSLVSLRLITILDTSQIMLRGMALSRSFRSGFKYRI